MPLIYSSFSNNLQRELHGLLGEFTELLSYLNSKDIKKRVDFQASYGQPVPKLTSDLIKHQQDLRLFHFSGHSSQDGLDFPEEDFASEHFSSFFEALNTDDNQLECVLLNGCSNATLVKQLRNVPVVIGSRSPISNADAIKFTGDFFRALVGGKQSYAAAFKQAYEALPNAEGQVIQVRGGGPVAALEKPLNDYFMVINEKEIAERGFPFKKPPVSPAVKWLMVLVFLIAGGLGSWWYLNLDNFKDESRGYRCPNWQDPEKCNILVADFNKPDANTFISEGINGNLTLNRYLEAYYALSFKELIPNNEIHFSQLPDNCDFEYILTGDVRQDESEIAIELIPNVQDNPQREKYLISSLFDFKDSILSIRDIYQDQFIINQICVACAKKNNQLVPLAESQIRQLKDQPGAEVAYQELNEQMAVIYLDQTDTVGAIRSLNRVAKAKNNTRALVALEQQSQLQLATLQYTAAYQTQSIYLQKLQPLLREAQSSDPELLQGYKKADYQLRLQRANIVLNQPDQLAYANEQALQDFEYLRKIRGADFFNNEIQTLRLRLNRNNLEPVAPPSDPPAILKILDRRNGQVLANASLIYNNQRFYSNREGIIKIPCSNDECLGQQIEIVREGYQAFPTRIRRRSNGMRIQMEANARTVETIQVLGQVVDANNKPISGVLVALGQEQAETNRNGRFSLGSFPKNDLPGDVLYFNKSGFISENMPLEQFLVNSEIMLRAQPPAQKDYTIYGSVQDCDFENTTLNSILINGERVRILRGSLYKHPIKGFPGEKVTIEVPGNRQLSNRNNASFELGEEDRIQKNLVLKEKSTKSYQVQGILRRDGKPIPGMTVILEGSNIGASTDLDGRFKLQVTGQLCQKLAINPGRGLSNFVELRRYQINEENVMLIKVDY